MCSFFDDLSSLKNCVMNALRNCEENSNLLGWVRASDAIGDFTYPYVLENQEFCMEYISTTVIKYTKNCIFECLQMEFSTIRIAIRGTQVEQSQNL